MLGDPYALPLDLEARLKRSDDGTYTQVLDAASRDVERFTGRQFNNTTTATPRTYRPMVHNFVVVDDFYTTTGLIVATDDDGDGTYETVWAAADFELEPANSVDGWPFWVVRAVDSKWFPCSRRRSLQVTAKWGWTTVPAAIREATLDVAEEKKTGKAGPLVSETIDGYSYTFAGRTSGELLGAMSQAGPYRRHLGFA